MEPPDLAPVAEQGRLIIQDNQRYIAALMQARMGSHPVDHAPIVTAPAVVLDVLREAWPRSGAVGLRAFPHSGAEGSQRRPTPI